MCVCVCVCICGCVCQNQTKSLGHRCIMGCLVFVAVVIPADQFMITEWTAGLCQTGEHRWVYSCRRCLWGKQLLYVAWHHSKWANHMQELRSIISPPHPDSHLFTVLTCCHTANQSLSQLSVMSHMSVRGSWQNLNTRRADGRVRFAPLKRHDDDDDDDDCYNKGCF